MTDGTRTTTAAERSAGSLPWLLLGLFVAALTLRPQIIAIGPLFPRIEAELGLSYAAAGMLGTIPVLCLGLFAPAAPALTARLSHERAIAGCLFSIGAFGVARAFAPGTTWLIALTVGLGIAMGIAGALLPVAVKAGAPERPAFATGIYAAGIQLGAAATAVAVVPLAAVSSWRWSLVAISVAAILSASWWSVLARGTTSHRIRRRPLPLGDGFAWLLALVFFLQAVPYFGLNAWLPVYLVEADWSDRAAGNVQAVMNVASLVASLSVPLLVDRVGSRRTYLIGAGAVVGCTVPLLIFRPDWAAVLAVVLGLCMGVLFAVSLVLPLDVAHDPPGVAAAAGMILGAGYVGASLAPTLLGVIRDLAGGFVAPLWAVALSMLALVLVCLPLSPERLRRGVAVAAVPRDDERKT